MSRVWLKSAVPKARMMIGFSAVGMSMSLSASSQAQNRADDERFLRIDTDSTQLCEELVGSSTNHRFITELGVPVAVKGDEFFAYDDARSVQTKTIWTSMNGFGGVAFHAIEMDNADGKCPRGKKFSLLKKIASTQACKDCMLKPSPQDGQHPCGPAPFSVVCSYRLPDKNEPQPLMPTDIPYANCTEVVVEDALWNADGHLRFRDTDARQHLVVLKNHREQNEAARKTRVIAAIKCTMLPEKLEEMLKSDRNITSSILEHVARYSFDGVEMRCDHVLTEKTRADYMKFTQLLQAHLHSYHHYSACPSTLSIRIPVWNTNLDAKYDVNVLNSLDHLVLEPFEVSQHARLISPLFGLDKSEESHAIDSTIAAWIEAGVYSKKIVMHIPAYGIQQHFTTALETIGANVERNYTMVTQRDICSIAKTAGVNEHTLYDLVAAFTTTPQRQWITYETAPIVAYKARSKDGAT
ncbi:Chitinase-like protein C25A8.4 [Aphelenchoides fujianensis]|nr:Chitinase-like protein C25A8.4 [Aphelenchoides fujianensis]